MVFYREEKLYKCYSLFFSLRSNWAFQMALGLKLGLDEGFTSIDCSFSSSFSTEAWIGVLQHNHFSSSLIFHFLIFEVQNLSSVEMFYFYISIFFDINNVISIFG